MKLFKALLYPPYYKKVQIDDRKSFHVEWTHNAELVLQHRKTPLKIEMSLYFSCMVIKMVTFYDEEELAVVNKKADNFHHITDKISVWFHPMISQTCEVNDKLHQKPMIDVDLENLNYYHPKKLSIDFKNQQWEGNFC